MTQKCSQLFLWLVTRRVLLPKPLNVPLLVIVVGVAILVTLPNLQLRAVVELAVLEVKAGVCPVSVASIPTISPNTHGEGSHTAGTGRREACSNAGEDNTIEHVPAPTQGFILAELTICRVAVYDVEAPVFLH